jgi:hypothetical protein
MINNYDSVVACAFTATPHSQKQEGTSYTATKRNWLSFVTVLVTLFCFSFVQGQIAVTVTGSTNTTPALSASYVSLSSALTDLNAVTAMSGPVVLTLDSGTSETAPIKGFVLGSATLNPVLSATNTITINKSGAGAVTINAGIGTSNGPTATPDGMFYLLGADYVTIDGLTFIDGNSASATFAMEFGVAMFKRTAGDGCNNNIVQNCIFNMQRINNSSGSGPMVEGSVGINVVNSIPTAAITALTPTNGGTLATNGTNSNNKFYSNTINGGNYGIALSGFAATVGRGPNPDATSFLGDINNDIGGTAVGTGNAILNFGGGATTNPAAGIRANFQWGVNISYNTINNNNGSGVNHATTLRGIYAQAGVSGNATINNNTVTVSSGAASSALTAIDNGIGATAASNIININNNVIRFSYTTATTGVFTAISNGASAGAVNINGNNIQQVASTVYPSTGTIPVIVGGSPGGTLSISNNTIANFNMTGATGTLRAITATTPIGLYTCSGNTIENLSYSTATSTGSIDGIYNLSSATLQNWNNNIIRNFSTPTTGTLRGIVNNTVAGTFNIYNNQVYNFSTTSGGAGGGTFTGITSLNGTANVYNNTVYALNSTGSTGGSAGTITGLIISGTPANNVYGNKIYNLSSTSSGPLVAGITISGGTTNNIYNNLIGDLRATAATAATSPTVFPDMVKGINITSTTTSSNQNVYNNTIYLNASSSGTNFGTSGIFHTSSGTSTTSALDLQNNIIINTSTASGTGKTVAFRRSGGGFDNFRTTSNNNLFFAGATSASNLIMTDNNLQNYQTISDYKNAFSLSPRETNSFTESSITPATYFESTTGSDANYLQPKAALVTQAEGGGNTIAIASPDYNGVTRPGTPGTSFDVGAWEFNGVSPAPVFTTLVAAPALTAQCTKADRSISIDVTTSSGTISSVTLNYSHNGTAQTPVAMTNSSGNTYTGTMIAPVTGNETVTWSIAATNSLGITTTFAGTSYADEPTTGVTATATASVNPVCSGSPTSLSIIPSRSGSNSSTIGSGTSLNSTSANIGAFYGTWWGNSRSQILIRASELTNAGLVAGNITGLRVNITGGTPALCTGFNIKIASTSATSITGAFATGTFTNVFGPTNYTPTVGLNTHTFSTPFIWDGVSNIIVEYCYSNQVTGSSSPTNTTTTTAFASTVLYGADGTTLACGNNTVSTSSSVRPNIILVGNAVQTPSSVSWSDGSTTVGSGNPFIVNPTAATTYTGTATVAGCPVSASTPLVNVNPLPTAPSATDSTQCGLAVPTASVADTNSFTTPTFNWYDAATAGTLLQTNVSTTYITAISATTTFYVSVINPTTGCESARTPVTVTVNAPDPIAATANDTTICLGDSVTLTGANTASTPTQTYTYSWLSTANSGLTTAQTGTSISVTPDTVGSYTYTATASGGGCQTTATVTVTVNALPNINSATASSTVSCVGNTINLAATANDILSGTASLGAGATNSSSTAQSFFPGLWGGTKTQYIIRASELTAAGISAGPITSLGFEPTDSGQTYQGFNVSLGSTSATTAPTTTFIPNTGLTLVYKGTLTNDGYTPVANTVNNLTFGTGTGTASSFDWDGSSNVVVSISWSRVPGAATATATTMKVDDVGFVSSAYRQRDNVSPTAMADETSVLGTSSSRPKFIFGGQIDTNTTANYTWTWSDGTTNVLSAATGSVVLSASATYTATATNTTTGCSSNSLPIAVTANPIPTAPSATDSTQCGLAVPTASVADPNSFTTPIFKWYNVATAGTALQSTTSTTYTTAISATTTFYVSVVNPTTGCESARTAVMVTVSQPDSIGASANDTSICLGESVTLTAANTASTPTQSYTYSWLSTANSGLTTAQTGASISVTPIDLGSYTYTVTASGGACQTTATVIVTVSAVPNINSATASALVACAGSTINLAATANDILSGTATLGAGATDSNLTAQSFLPGGWGGTKTQYIIRASELTAAGISAGAITSLGFEPTDSGQTYQGFSVSLGSTSDITAPTTTFIPNTGLTLVYKGTEANDGYTPVASTVNNLVFGTGTGTASNFDWDGSSNVVVSISWSRVPGAFNATSTTMKVDDVGFVSSAYSQRDNLAPTAMANETSVLGTSTKRPKFIFGGQIDTNTTANYTWTWSDGATTVLSAATGSVILPASATTTYTATATNATTGCASNSLPITVTANPLPTAPTATNSVQCGSIVPTASVSDTNTFASAAIYNWYATATSTTPLQSSTSATFTSLVSTTTTFHVAVANPTTGCESARVPVTVTVNIPDLLSASANDTTICVGQSVTISTANLASTPTQNYTYSWASTTGSGLTAGQTAASFTVTPTTAGSYIYTVTGVDGPCQTTASVTVVVSALPVVTLDVPSTILACAGSTVNLGASVNVISAGTTAPSGIGTSYTLDSDYPTFFGNYWNEDWSQMVYTATELQAMGLSPGDITSISFNIGALPDPTTVNGYSIRLGATSNNTLSAFQTAGLTTVYGPVNHTVTAAGNVTINFTTPYNWDGSSNIIVDVRGTGQFSNANATTQYTTTTGNTVLFARATFTANPNLWTSNPTTFTSTSRPNVRFGGQVSTNQNANYAWSWSDGTTNVLTTASGTVTLPAGTTTYTATATHLVSGCSNVANSAQVVATAVSTTAPVGVATIAPSSICFGGSVSLSLDYTGSTQGLVYQWESSINNGGLWQDIATATTSTFTTTQSVETQYRCKLISCGGTPGYSSVATVGFTNTISSTTPATRCGSGTAIINAVANAGTIISWYANASGGNPVGTGSPFTTPVLNATTTYYVSAETITNANVALGSTAAINTALGTSGSPNGGMVFTTTTNNVVINSVDVLFSGTGDLTIKLQDATGTDIASTTVTGATGTATALTNIVLPSTFVVPTAGTGYRILCTSRGAGISWYYQTGAYPFTTPGVSITGGYGWSSTTTYATDLRFVHRMNLTVPTVCASPRVPVTVTVNPAPPLTLSSSSATICSGSATAAITATAPDYDTFVWSPATGVTGNSTTGWTFNPTATTTYTLTASQSAGICENIATFTVNVNAVPSAITFTPASPSVCVDDVLTLTAAGGVFSNSLLSQTMDFLPANFISSANATIANNTTYFAQGTGSVRFTAPSNANDWLALNQNVNLVGASSATLTFSHIAATEDGFDFGYVEYSTDGGSTWTTFAPANYAGTASTYAANSSFASDSYTDWASTFTGATSTPGAGPATSLWKAETFNIPAAALTSSQFRIRFRYTSDGSVNYYGWLIDDVKIQRSQSNITWSPPTNLYTNAAATTPYTAGTNATTVYVKSASAATTVYTATSTNTVTTCATNATVSVVVNALPTVVAVNPAAVCSPSTVDLTAAAVTTGSDTGLTFTYWTNVGATTALTSPSAVATSGTYYIKGTNANGCSVIVPVTVTVNPLPVLTITDPATVCSPATVNITASAVTTGSDTGLTLTYWSDITATTALTTASAVTTSGTYYIKAVNANGCQEIKPVTVTINVTSAPTGTASQSFCGSATLSQLVATGTNIKWYNAATGGTEYPSSLWTLVGLQTGTTYYASQTVNGCESTTRFAVTAVINAIPTAPNAAAQDFCSAPTVAQLLPNGSTINWYDVSTAGSPLASSTVLSATTYYVSQTINGCESARTAVTITITPIAAPTGAASQTIFGGVAADATIEDISVSGTNVIWYPTAPDAAAGTNAIAAGTQLVDGQTYYAVSVVGSCRSAALAVTTVVVLEGENFDIKALRYYPNPVIDVLTISYTNEITAVQVYDISGRLVRDMKPNSNEVTVDLSDLAASVYVVKVFADTTSGEFKVVKK